MASRYTHKYKAFGDAVLRSPEMVGLMLARAEAIKARAIASAPRETGEYAASFNASAGIGKAAGKSRRAVGTVENTSDHAAAVEFGGDHTPAYHTLTTAMLGG